MSDEETLAQLSEQMADLAHSDQERAHVGHDASLIVHYWQTLSKGGLPEDLVGELTTNWQDFLLGMASNRGEVFEDDE